MDLVTHTIEASASELEALDTVCGVRPSDDRTVVGDSSRLSQRSLLLPSLHALQDRVGWISPAAVDELARRIDVAPAEIFGVASFYALFSLADSPTRQVHACIDLACRAAGTSEAVLPAGVHPSPCLGLCDRAPAVLVVQAGIEPWSELHGPVAPVGLAALLHADPAPANDAVWRRSEGAVAAPQSGDPSLVLLSRVGVVDPSSLSEYRAHGGYAALRRAFELGPVGVIREVTDANLIGRGGAGFPTGRKWDAVARQPARPHYLVCNADESEPGTFKDRVLMEGDPFSLIESITIAAYATGCSKGWIYLRAEYPRAYERLSTAIAEARRMGFLGTDILGHGFDFDIEISRGAGAYICGEETAIFNSIEGYRGEPRNKPPFPVEVGLFGKPTLVNNVETLVNVLPILTMGGAAYGALGTTGSTGRKLFCISGAVTTPGVYEVEFGVTLRELIELAGGVSAGHTMQAVLLGGAAGGYAGPSDLDLPLTFEATRTAGVALGSGVVMVLDETVDLPDQLVRIAAFFRDESCGQCVPCRVGTVRQQEAVARLAAGRTDEDIALLKDLAQVMRDASICGLGQTAANAIDSAITRLGVFS
jgi:NADH-quinone oxidoreductase subunit F